MRTPLRWTVALLVMLVIAPVSAMALEPYLDPNVRSGTLIVDGQELGFYRAGANLNLANAPDYNWTYITPEPGMLSLLAFGALALGRRRRT